MAWGTSAGEHFLASNPAPQVWARLADLRKDPWLWDAGLPVLAPSPPALSLSAADAGTSIGAGNHDYLFVSGGVYVPNLVTTGGGPLTIDTINGRIYFNWTGNTSAPTGSEDTPFAYIEVITDAPAFEWWLNGQGSLYRLLQNGQVITPGGAGGSHNPGTSVWVTGQIMPNNGSNYRLLVNNGTRAFRRQRLEWCKGAGSRSKTVGITALTTDTIMPAPRRGPRVIIVLDSQGEGAGLPNNDTSSAWTQTLAWQTGWDIWPHAFGGTGYVNASMGNGGTANATQYLPDITGNAPDAVIWYLGINDVNVNGGASLPANKAAIQANALLCYQTVATALPNVPQIVLGPAVGTGNQAQSNANWQACRDAIKAAALAAGLPFADPAGTGYLRGTGKVGATVGDGNADFLVSNDGTHPTQAGNDAMARIVGEVIAAALAS